MHPAALTGAPRAVVFDLDGTLIDSYDAIRESLNRVRAEHGLSPLDPDTVRRGVGRGLENLVAEFVGADRTQNGVESFRRHYRELFLHHTHALPGAAAALNRLSALGLPLGIASNKPAYFTVPILRHLRLEQHFRSVEGPDTAGATKPDPRMLRRCLAALAVSAGDALYVGDMVLDVETGERAKVPVALVAGGSSPREALEATGCPVFSNLATMVERIASAGKSRGARPGGTEP